MINRAGQVWRKTAQRASDIIVISSSAESRKLGLKTGQTLTSGTNHTIARFLHKTSSFDIETWYEPENDRWEEKAFFTRTA